MPATVRIPTSLRKLTGGQDVLAVQGGTIAEALADLDRQYPGFKERLCDASGHPKRFVNFFVNEEDIRFLEDVATPIKDGDEISIVPAIAGGGGSRV